jgi:hypothetical protein
MRKGLFLVAGWTAALIAIAAGSMAFAATKSLPNGNTQEFDLVTSPKALSKTKPTPVSVKFIGDAGSTTSIAPVPSTKEIFDFDKSVAVYAKGLPVCKLSQIVNATTSEAQKACGRAKIGNGNATAVLPLGEEVVPAPGKVLIFNGPPKRGMPTVLLHSYATVPAPQTLVLNGTYSHYDKKGYGLRLTIPIPPLAGGLASMTKSLTVFNRKWSYKGKKRSYFTALCKTGKLKSRASYEYQDHQKSEIAVSHGCTKRP